ncbi:hypothetical protein [Runella rosea]|uniref:hypothetical protein n=1 Tax=Runella rosea TaxID=2259595 RepID=UPI0013B4554A|nr:hypothetical protein [Runella rosea]
MRGNFLMLTGTLFGVDSALTAVTKTFEVINDFQRYRNALEVASGSTKRFNSNLIFLEKLANDTGTAIGTLYQPSPNWRPLRVALPCRAKKYGIYFRALLKWAHLSR